MTESLDPRSARQKLAIAYFMLQAVAGAAWWWALSLSTEWRDVFWSRAIDDSVLWAFGFADMLAFVGGSAVAAVLVATRIRLAQPAAWIVVGVAAYAALFCVGQYLATGEAAIAVVLMTLAVSGSVLAAVWTP